MTHSTNHPNLDRRQFLKRSGSLAAGATVLGGLAPTAFAAGDSTIRLALIGCGGRGTGAVTQALMSTKTPVKLSTSPTMRPPSPSRL